VLRRSQTIQQVREGTLHTEIVYDRREKRYRLVAVNGVELGSYRQRRQAEEAQLALEAPEALELARRAADRYPVLAGRALRAAQLVAAGKVHLDTTLRQAQGSACHRVESQTCPEPSRRNGAGEYQVEQTNGTWRCTCPDWQASFAGERRLKGKSAPQRLWRLDGVKAGVRRFDVAVDRGLTKLVGRDAELESLHGAWERVKAGAVALTDDELAGELSRLFVGYLR
jgi:hypothetical protein